MRLLSSAGLIALMTATAAAAGPWPRGEGQVFVSVGYEGRIDLDRLPLYVLDHGGTLYAEYGTGARTTLVLDVHSDLLDSHTAILSLRRTITAPEARNQLALSLGAGTRTDPVGDEALLVAGASWGRGFATRWGDGWASLEAQARFRASGDTALKLDATLGLKPREGWMVIGQLQLAQFPGSDLTARLQATAVRRLTDRLSLETGFVYGLENDTRAGLTFSLWAEF